MAPHNFDSSDDENEEYTLTKVLLGYASREPTDDSISQLGGSPSWLNPGNPPSAALAMCKICNDMMPLILQLHGDLPEQFPSHERRLHVFACRRRTCQRKEGSIRALRSIRISLPSTNSAGKGSQKKQKDTNSLVASPLLDLGGSIFGSNALSGGSPNLNPFSISSSTTSKLILPNPFAKPLQTTPRAQTPLTTQPQPVTTFLSETFASKARLTSEPSKPGPAKNFPWPSPSLLPTPYLTYHLDADYETLDTSPLRPTPTSTMDLDDLALLSSPAKEDVDTFESTIDATFQRFADRLAQNPLQVLRYEFRGSPLLYSKTDAVGKALTQGHQIESGGSKGTTTTGNVAGMPRCGSCGRERVFECQLTPQAIVKLEESDESVGLNLGEGMDWGTVVVGVCGGDCGGFAAVGEVCYAEEWAGVQWEERG